MERIVMRRGEIYENEKAMIDDFYFVERGMISLVKSMRDGRTVEIGTVGHEGVADPTGIFDSQRAILESVVQIPGTALRIPREKLKRAMAQSPEIMEMMQRYASVALSQFAQTAACNCLHTIEQRCCRWLLIAGDTALEDTFPLTHEFLAMMLGVQRSSVSLAAAGLQRRKIITYKRGVVTILDRPALEAAACECYATMRDQFDAIFR
jgi:CRP-like cAMP-binding protein